MLEVRWREHLGISCFTGEPVKWIKNGGQGSLKNRQRKSNFTDFEVICCESNHALRELKESLFIK